MAGKDNLKPPRSKDEARERGKKGGKASGAARRAKRDAKETARLLLGLPAAEQLDANLKLINIKPFERTNLMGVLVKHMIQAQSGNVKSGQFIMEIAGYMQKNNPENNLNVNIGKDEDVKVVLYIPDSGSDRTDDE